MIVIVVIVVVIIFVVVIVIIVVIVTVVTVVIVVTGDCKINCLVIAVTSCYSFCCSTNNKKKDCFCLQTPVLLLVLIAGVALGFQC